DAEGRLVRVVGREGSGPGEFRRLDALGLLGDTLWVFDSGNTRFGYFTLDGELIRHRLVTIDLGGGRAVTRRDRKGTSATAPSAASRRRGRRKSSPAGSPRRRSSASTRRVLRSTPSPSSTGSTHPRHQGPGSARRVGDLRGATVLGHAIGAHRAVRD